MTSPDEEAVAGSVPAPPSPDAPAEPAPPELNELPPDELVPPAASALKAEHVDFVAEHTELTPEEAAERTKAELIEHEQAIVADGSAPMADSGDLPSAMAQHAPAALDPLAPASSASNESPVLPANLHGAAVRAHGVLSGAQDETELAAVKSLVAIALAELERFLPDSLLVHSQAEGARMVREQPS